jgi:hypothetical protein
MATTKIPCSGRMSPTRPFSWLLVRWRAPTATLLRRRSLSTSPLFFGNSTGRYYAVNFFNGLRAAVGLRAGGGVGIAGDRPGGREIGARLAVYRRPLAGEVSGLLDVARGVAYSGAAEA